MKTCRPSSDYLRESPLTADRRQAEALPFRLLRRAPVLLLSFLLIVGAGIALADPEGSNSKVDKAFVSFRIGPAQSLSETRYHQLLDLLDKYKAATDDITFFTAQTHPPLPLDVFKDRVKILSLRMKLARERGYRSGINILATIGHHEENLENSLRGNCTPMTDIDGRVCRGSFCPNDENLRRYVREIYRAAASANPDYVWIDDDVRLAGHMPLNLTCFCDNCLAIFEKETGAKYTRESFKKAVNEGPIEEKLKLRRAWLQHNRNTIARLFRLIEETAHEIRPALPLGFMTGDRFFEGYDFAAWAKILAGPNHVPVNWRPGGGFYQDLNTAELAGKSHDIGRQVSRLPDEVLSIQSEIENFPYQRLKKAANIVVLEASSHIAAGSTGAAFNVLSFYDEPLDEFEPLVAEIRKARPFLDLMARSLGRSKIAGIQTFWNEDSYATANLTAGSWFDSAALLPSYEIYDIGLPACYSQKQASVIILGKDNVYALSRNELEALLSRGVYMDAETVRKLNDMGFRDLTGFEVVGSEKADRIEKFSDHALNGTFAGRRRDGRQSFLGWRVPAYVLKKIDDKAQILSGLIDYADKETAPCTMGIFENRLGGRICVSGYYPWTFLENLSKSSQLKSVFRWLSRDTLPGYIASFHKINLWIREPQNGKIALAFTNASFDEAENVVLMLRTESQTATIYDMNCAQTVIRSTESDGPYRKFVIPSIAPWQMRLVVTKP
jgi:hypothetical protein